ncbi:hypothetical protein EV640_108159 [Nesterenkonia aurantiaca]|uniref:Uncharacterized protein n=1 Tax=Nesterenkonia aurantiaca TaxID=1436010 RepID=A0A4R7FZH0_9MICC|nr:hypothetical protein EV640_108159 [Nesterenkonia aurantiaca]
MHGSFSHAARFEVIDSTWPKSQRNLFQAAPTQCLKLKPGMDQRNFSREGARDYGSMPRG